jgi:hypothetical protein
MRELLVVAGAVMCVLGTPAFAATGVFHAQGQSAGIAASVAIPGQKIGSFLVLDGWDAAILVAQAERDRQPPGNSGSNGNDHPKDCDQKDHEEDDHKVTRSHPCKGNNGFGNGGGDGTPNGFPDQYR